MILLDSVVESTHGEIYPFFDWSLFSGTPEWYITENTLSVNSIDGDPARAIPYLIPTEDIRDHKALRKAVNACRNDLNCDETVEEVLYPIVKRLTGEEEVTSIDFTIARSRIDLRHVQEKISELAEGTLTRADFYQPYKVIGRWDIREGQLATPFLFQGE